MLLGDMGADVIKIEEPTDGDDARVWGPFIGDRGAPTSSASTATSAASRST